MVEKSYAYGLTAEDMTHRRSARLCEELGIRHEMLSLFTPEQIGKWEKDEEYSWPWEGACQKRPGCLGFAGMKHR